LMICVNIIKKAAKVLAAIFMIFYLTERKFVVLFLTYSVFIKRIKTIFLIL
jgi:hypothetical protein